MIRLAPVLLILLFPLSAQAGKLPIFQGSAGGIFTIGGDMWTEPDAPADIDTIPFGGMAGGLGVGGGVFFEARFIKYIGLELDLLFEHNSQWYSVETTVSSVTVKVRYQMKYAAIPRCSASA